MQTDGTQVMAEWWQETNPPYAIRLIKERRVSNPTQREQGGQQIESAADGTTSSEYDAGTNTIYQRPDSTSPTLTDPIETVRAELTQGTAQVAGTVTIDGQSLYKIELPGGVVGYFDRTDYQPVYLDNPQRDGTVVRTRVTTYEELPITPRTKRCSASPHSIREHPSHRPHRPRRPGRSRPDAANAGGGTSHRGCLHRRRCGRGGHPARGKRIRALRLPQEAM